MESNFRTVILGNLEDLKNKIIMINLFAFKNKNKTKKIKKKKEQPGTVSKIRQI